MKKKLEIIAEMGQGFEGSFDLAMLLSKSASNTNVDSVKFQMVFADELAVKNYAYFNLFKSLELKLTDWQKIVSYLKRNNKKIYFDIFGEKSLSYSEKLKVDGVKIHPTDILNFDFLEKVRESKIKKILLGIGGINLKSIEQVVNFFNKKKIVLLNGFQAYPTKINENNLNNISVLKKKYYRKNSIDYGFADHESSSFINTLLVSTLAIGAGANYIEKHFTLTETLKMEDYESALTPEKFDEFVTNLNNVFKAKNSLNFDKYKISFSEKKYHQTNIRQVITKKNILKNKVIRRKDLILKRSNEKFAIHDLDKCVGKKSKVFIKSGTPINNKLIK